MVFGTCFGFVISMFIRFGQLLYTISIVNMLLSIFLSFKFNRYYFDILGCEKLSNCCCMCFVRLITKKVSMSIAEIQLATHISKQNIPKLMMKSVNMIHVPSNTNITVNTPELQLNEQYSADIKDVMPIKHVSQLTPADPVIKST
eukprot:883816_1